MNDHYDDDDNDGHYDDDDGHWWWSNTLLSNTVAVSRWDWRWRWLETGDHTELSSAAVARLRCLRWVGEWSTGARSTTSHQLTLLTSAHLYHGHTCASTSPWSWSQVTNIVTTQGCIPYLKCKTGLSEKYFPPFFKKLNNIGFREVLWPSVICILYYLCCSWIQINLLCKSELNQKILNSFLKLLNKNFEGKLHLHSASIFISFNIDC